MEGPLSTLDLAFARLCETVKVAGIGDVSIYWSALLKGYFVGQWSEVEDYRRKHEQAGDLLIVRLDDEELALLCTQWARSWNLVVGRDQGREDVELEAASLNSAFRGRDGKSS